MPIIEQPLPTLRVVQVAASQRAIVWAAVRLRVFKIVPEHPLQNFQAVLDAAEPETGHLPCIRAQEEDSEEANEQRNDPFRQRATKH